MKKDQNLPQKKTFTLIIVSENHFQTVQIIREINHLITLTTEVDQRPKKFT